jgi:MutS-like protein
MPAFPTAADVKAEYDRRLRGYESSARDLQRKHVWTGNARVLLFVVLALLAWRSHVYWLAAAFVVFVALAVLHRRILRAKNYSERAAEFYRRGILRLEDRWTGTGENGDQFRDPDHVYADDLDIFGSGSLFELLCLARSPMGNQTLASWLLHPAAVDTIRERHQAVRELSEKLVLRQDLALAGESSDIKADPARLRAWGNAQIEFNDRFWLPVALALAALSLAGLACAIAFFVYTGRFFWTPFLVTLMINGVVLFSLRHPLEKLTLNLDQAGHNLDALASILHRLENEQFTSPLLQQCRQKLLSHGKSASRCIAALDTLCELEDSLHNMFVRLINLPLLYSLVVACRLQNWRRQHGAAIAHWLEVVGDIEALASLGTYSCEHPEDPFPEFASGAETCFAGTALGHPLLPADQCVRNDLSLGGQNQVLLVSGSNMSGKSTLLRVVGINTVLAMMGAPVRAARLRLSPAAVGACMRISDSLRKGVSHFYAEIKRIRQVVELSSQGTLIFLFDEMLQGTNSHDRRVGAEGILRTLISNGALGLVTTHDLALTSLADIFPDRVANVHFQEKLEAGELSFDYKLRPGIVHTSNGVELMRSVGLEV